MSENKANYFKLKQALSRLEERYNDYREIDQRPELRPSDIESIQESCIQRFETCFDTVWKHLKKHLQEVTGLLEIPNSPKPIFRIAAENGVIEAFDVWNNYNQKRINTAHDYSSSKAEETFAVIPHFIADAIVLYELMAGDKW